MKQVNITIRTEDVDDIRFALDEIVSQVEQGFTQGWNEGEAGEYHFTVTEPSTKRRRHETTRSGNR